MSTGTAAARSGCGTPVDDGRCTSCGRLALLDTFCKQGGASAGYQRAGWCTTGVDITDQPRYPWWFATADAVAFIRAHGHAYTAIHASPPCQAYSACQRLHGRPHPDLIDRTRTALHNTGRTWVIENVEGAPLHDPLLLCGAMFPGQIHTYRHRLFETSTPAPAPAHPAHRAVVVKMGRPLGAGAWYHAVGNFSGVSYVRADLGVGWMNRDGIRECVPPLYTAWLGGWLLNAATAGAPVGAGVRS